MFRPQKFAVIAIEVSIPGHTALLADTRFVSINCVVLHNLGGVRPVLQGDALLMFAMGACGEEAKEESDQKQGVDRDFVFKGAPFQ